MLRQTKLSHTAIAVCTLLSILTASIIPSATVQAGFGFVILNSYSKTMKTGDECYLTAITSNGKKPTFSSSSSKVASVNTYGKITAKKAGTAKIKAKIKNGEAVCTVKVTATKIQLSSKHIILENGYTARLTADTSTGHPVTFRSSRSSIASVDASGKITAKKPGTATVTASADHTSVNCTVTVKQPKVILNKSSVSLYRNMRAILAVKSTSRSAPVWKSNKKSVAVVDHRGIVTAMKNGTAVISVTVDGVSKNCQVTVKKPTITFEKSEITLTTGKKKTVNVSVSSRNKPVFSSSNTCIATVDENGTVYAHEAGKAYIYASEDGTKSRIRVIVKAKTSKRK